jgi:adenylosuccinate lyase
MIDRYSLPEMTALWSQDTKYQLWLDVEFAVVEAQETLGRIPVGTAAKLRSKASIDAHRVDVLELEVKHDIIAFLTALAETVGEESRFVHLGMTSSDLIDTALSLLLQEAGQLILDKMKQLEKTILELAFEHKDTVMIGRSHGIHGEPITFGLKLLVWVEELRRGRKRLIAALEENRVGQISGAMGTYAHLEPEVERLTCQKLGLEPATVSTQVLQRDRHASLMCALGLLASSLEKFATEIRHLQRTDVLEVEEPFAKGQKGSSAMPHKRNPIACENITGLARLVRSYCQPAMENIALWHERDISHSSVERVILPDATTLVHYMLNRFNQVMAGLNVYPENMQRNMNRYGGIIFTQRVMLTLVEAGVSREEAYSLVQRNAMAAWNTEAGHFKTLLLADEQVTQRLSPEVLEACFDPKVLLRHVDVIFSRFEDPSLQKAEKTTVAS